MTISNDVLARLRAVVGAKGVVDDAAARAPYLREWRGRYQGETPLILCPATTEEVAAIVRICAETRTPLVAQGGNTGLVGGQIPCGEVLLSLRRLNRIRDVDAAGNSLAAEAGATLVKVQESAAMAERLFPLSLASEGTATLGGALSTNAGGTNVLRYGMARDLVLGLEVVLADGRVWHGLKTLYKDNTGYDLKQLFLGAEGTLGIITAAAVKLFPRPRDVATAWAAVADMGAAVELLSRARAAGGDTLTAFELIPRIGLDFILKHIPDTRDPLTAPSPWYVLMELTSTREGRARADLETFLDEAVAAGLATDAALAQSDRQRAEFWTLRDALSEVQKHEGGSIKHDVSVPISRMAAFVARASAAVTKACPGIRPVVFGHVGDGNVHFNLSQPPGADTAAFLARWEEINRIVHDIVREIDGSISAEHGVGLMKRDEIARTKSETDIDLMRRLKKALDPDNILNPGKLVP